MLLKSPYSFSLNPNRAPQVKASVDASWFLEMTAVERSIERWKLEEVALYSPLKDSVVVAKLDALSRLYSRDVVALYAATGGMEDGYSDSHMMSLWPLERLILETSRHNRAYILFADFLLEW